MGSSNQYKVSVILPIFNGRRTISKTLESIAAQDYSNFELIAVDDGSNDDSADVTAMYKTDFATRLGLIRQANQGVSHARNTGITQSKGKYLAFIDQDDVWEENKLSRQIEAITTTPDAGFIFNDFYRFDCHSSHRYDKTNTDLNSFIRGMPHEKKGPTLSFGIYDHADIFQLLLEGYPIYPSTMLIDRNLLLKAGLWNSRFPRCQDLDMSLRCSKYAKFVYIDEPLTGIGRHDTNVSSDPMLQKIEDTEVLHHHLAHDFFSAEEKTVIRKYLAQRLFGLAWNYRTKGNCRQARKEYIAGMKMGGGLIYGISRILLTVPPFNQLD